MLVDLSCNDFIEELASNSPAPGGGSVSALAGSLSASLVSMVANLSIGKEGRQTEEELIEVLASAAQLKEKLRDYVDQDTEAFNKVMAAFKLPKGNEEEKKLRSQAIQEATMAAAELPLQVAESCLEVLKLTKTVVTKGNPHALSDAGVAVLMAFAGMEGAHLNVDINLNSIKDEAFKERMLAAKHALQKEAVAVKEEVLQIVKEKLI